MVLHLISISKWLFLALSVLLILLLSSCSVNKDNINNESKQLAELEELALSITYNKQFGTSESDLAKGVTTNLNGNSAYIAGSTKGSLKGNNKGGSDAFVRSYNSNGNIKWTKQFGTNADDSANCITTDTDGNVYVAGFTEGNLIGNQKGLGDAFIRKFSPTGKVKWTKQFGTENSDSILGITTDSSKNVYVAGFTRGGLQGDNLGVYDAFIRKYNSNGKKLFTRQFGTNSVDWAVGIATDNNKNVYVVGFTGNNLQGTYQGGFDAFIRKYGSGGAVKWTKQFGTDTVDWALSVATDANGNAYVAGFTEGNLKNNNLGKRDAFIRKYSPDGAIEWTKQFGTKANEEVNGVATDVMGNVYLAGLTKGKLGNNNLVGYDSFMRKYSSAGIIKWTRQFGTNSYDEASDITTDINKNIYVVGFTQGGGNNQGSYDSFIRKYTP